MNVSMSRIILYATFILAGAWLLPTYAAAADADGNTFESLLKDGEIDVSFRYRYEYVDQDCCDPTQPPGTDFDEEANASTLRSRLSFRTGTWYDTQFFAEAEDVRTIFVDDYNAGAGDTPGRLKYPQVNDPEGTEINQAYVDYKGFDSIGLRLGRQRINLDNQRFVGGVAWRQNEQTFDAFSGTYTHKLFEGRYAYVRKVNRIFGDDVPAGTHKQNGTHLVNFSGEITDWGKLTGYYYFIDNQDAPLFSTSTIGARFAGKRPLESVSIRYALEYAYQEDEEDNPASYDADYFHADFGVIVDALDVGVGYELLSGDDDGRFITPLGTLHAFNGWADKFLAGGTGNPPGGLQDLYLKVQFKFGEYLAQARYHDFQGDDSGDDIGQEIDFRIGRPFGKHLRADLFYADFDAEGQFSSTNLSDTRKFWLQLALTL
jgi:hypothetical protein